MRLSTFQQKIISILEPLPIENQHLASTNLIERSQIKLAQTVTEILRRLRHSNRMVWDPWILKDDNIYRLFYLEGIEGTTPWWTFSKICGAISSDLEHWQDIGTLIEANPENDWESERICAGCAYKEDGVYYLFYSAGGKESRLRNEAIGLATSTDGLHFSRYSNDPLVIPEEDDPWYGRCNWKQHFHWRDPYIFKDEQTSKYYMFICASSKAINSLQGSIGLAVADKIYGPYTILPPAVEVPVDVVEGWPYYHLERPQVIYKNGKYNLFFSCFKQFFKPDWLQKMKHKRITNSSLYWYVSNKIEGPYIPVNNDDFVVRGSERTGMYGTNLLQVSTDPEEYIAYGWYHRLHALEVSPTFRVIWKDSYDSHASHGGRLNSDRSFQKPSNLDSLQIVLSKNKLA